MNQRKTFQIIWVNVKVRRKKRDKTFTEELKTFQPKATLQLPTLLKLYSGQVCSFSNTTYITVATKTFDDDQTPSISRSNITETNMK